MWQKFKGSHSESCTVCNEFDDENHRLNYCAKYKHVNRYNQPVKTDFNDIFSDDPVVLDNIIKEIAKVWNVQNANGTMNSD